RRDSVRQALEQRFSVENFISELPQAIGDRLVLGLHVDGRHYEAAVRVRVGDWLQVTDPHGRPLSGRDGILLPTVSEKREPRTRQLFESGESVSSSRTRVHGVALPASMLLNQTLEAIPHLGSVAAVFNSVLAGYNASSTSTVSSGATTARYTKGTYRAVDFLYDVLYDVTVQSADGSSAPSQRQAVLERALVGRHDRRLLRSRRRPSSEVTHATSAWWNGPDPDLEPDLESAPESEPQEADPTDEAPATDVPATPDRRDIGTGLLKTALPTLGRHRAGAGPNAMAYQEWWPFGRPDEEAGGTDPAATNPTATDTAPTDAPATEAAATEPAPTDTAPTAAPATDQAATPSTPTPSVVPVQVPRTSVVESFDHTEELRRAVFSVLPGSMSRIGTPEKAAIDTFTGVHSIAGALHRAMAGGYYSVPFNTNGGATEFVELSTVFHDAELVTEEDGTPQVDWMIHIDTEDVNVDNVAHRNSGSDALSASAAALFGAASGQFGSTISVPTLAGSRSVGMSDPGQQAGSVTLHKVKLEEPTVVLAGRTSTTVRGRGGRTATVEGTARVRILLQDADRMQLMTGYVPRATVDGPHAGNIELHARSAPDRQLRFSSTLGTWLPQLSRVDWVSHDDAGRLYDRVMRAVRAAAPDMLPPEENNRGNLLVAPAGEARGVKAHEYTNLMTITNLVRPEPLAARLHDILNGGISVILSRLGPGGTQEVVLNLSGTLDPASLTHRGMMWDGNSETYYGGFYELQGDRSTAYSVEGGFDVPLNYSTN
ncbi:hypothetical protein ACFWSG_42255, partial [Streptomyces sp. NPDC058548]